MLPSWGWGWSSNCLSGSLLIIFLIPLLLSVSNFSHRMTLGVKHVYGTRREGTARPHWGHTCRGGRQKWVGGAGLARGCKKSSQRALKFFCTTVATSHFAVPQQGKRPATMTNCEYDQTVTSQMTVLTRHPSHRKCWTKKKKTYNCTRSRNPPNKPNWSHGEG